MLTKYISHSRCARRLFVGLALLVVLCALRLPWLEADGGNSTFWAYGYFSYDEAAYTSGGRHAYLTGRFLDPEINEPHTFGGDWGMHFLAYLGYKLAGLTLSAIRWPNMVLAIAAWLAIYVIAARRTPALVAGIVIALMSCNPASLTYERTASTDVVVGSLAVLSFMAITARRPLLALAAGTCMALACTVKANAVVLLPLVLLGAKQRRGFRLGLATAAFCVGLAALWWGRQLAVIGSSDGHDPAWVLAESSRWQTSLASLPYNPVDWFKPVSVFPRWNNSMLLGPFAVWALALPACWLLMFWWRTGRWWSRQHAMPVGMLIYTGALASQPYNSFRHYLPLLFFVPLLLVQSRGLCRPAETPPRRGAVTLLVGAIVMLCLLYWRQTDRGATPEKVALIGYNAFTVPHNAWPISGVRLVVGCLLLSVAIANVLSGGKNRAVTSRWLISVGLAVVLVWLFFANYTYSLLSIDSDFVIAQILLQLSLAGMCAALLIWPAVRHRWQTWWLAHVFLLAAFIAGNSYWSKAYGELWACTYFTRDASRQLAAALPADAVVIGRRTSTLLRNVPVRLGMCVQYEPDEFMKRIASLLADHPVFWLVDGDEDSQWERCKNAVRKRWRISYVTTVQIPSGDLLHIREVEEQFPMVPVHLMRIGGAAKTSTATAPAS